MKRDNQKLTMFVKALKDNGFEQCEGSFDHTLFVKNESEIHFHEARPDNLYVMVTRDFRFHVPLSLIDSRFIKRLMKLF